jgi:hypothetical protein
MSPVQNVTHVPVHSSLRRAWFPCRREARKMRLVSVLLMRVGVAGGKGPLWRVEEDLRAGDREAMPPYNMLLGRIIDGLWL